MTSSPVPHLHLAQTRYEPAAAERTVGCPHCGGPVDVAPVRVLPVLRAVPAVVVFEVESVRAPVARLFNALVEVVDGRRPVEQLRRVAAPPVLRYVRAACPTRRPRRVGQVRSWRVSRPAENAVEASAVVALNGRVRAVAAGLELEAGEWLCTSVRIL
ncbi:hypothetical protein I4I73_06460 [Pseudonocardia sp. KRD-184]|uniref:Uncharacterized protein n=1 Tax=Pseudonocardia oceani TaxID=2792013 RepID=A0ABS6U321_9PSEU|nr:Rv3235 family protein [Pseudonocardia oceani]MBW0088702.1 hypothetical protein [Pseudonocardia oceani]MBW0095641.1 hypothetical protein [Pseudonocardia oceani]MBW0121826.1 hypothetical protein [Pseudonocardia oceani]MBW0126618.1 hypothetical protein [Pseudonocardia oceani]